MTTFVLALLLCATATAGKPRLTERGSVPVNRVTADAHAVPGQVAAERANPRSVNRARVQVAKKLNRALERTPMRTTGYQLEAAGHRYRIHPAFIAAIAGTESSFGAAACSNNRFNAFGLASCGYGWRVPYFRSWKQAYLFMARFLTERWPHATSPHHYYGYAACSACWGRKTAYYMRRLGFGESVRYP